MSTTATTPGTGNGAHYEKTTYDEYGRIFQVFDASRTTADYTHNGERYRYNARGHLWRVRDAEGAVSNGAFQTDRGCARSPPWTRGATFSPRRSEAR